jgi:hypothetical protein
MLLAPNNEKSLLVESIVTEKNVYVVLAVPYGKRGK